jgi:23S rRNA pseudouridine1911/1915/1917 synthase
MSDPRYFDLTLDESGERLDRALAVRLPALSRSQLQRLIREGHVRVDGHAVKASYRLEGGERVIVTLPEPQETDLIPQAIPLDIRFEDDDLLVVNKRAGMVVHPAPGHADGTLVNAVLAHCPDLPGIGGEKRPGIVHRLDRDTSGLIIVAKNDQALRHLQRQFKQRSVRKKYLALVEGIPQQRRALIDAPIGRNPGNRKQMAVIAPGSGAQSRPARTRYEVVGTYDGYALLACFPETGRTHQIRVHLRFIAHPIAGDEVYGFRRRRLDIERHFLHAAGLTFRRPHDEQELSLEAELPEDLQRVLDGLGRPSP